MFPWEIMENVKNLSMLKRKIVDPLQRLMEVNKTQTFTWMFSKSHRWTDLILKVKGHVDLICVLKEM